MTMKPAGRPAPKVDKISSKLANENLKLEQKLQALKDQMSREKAQRDARRSDKGNLWRSATADRPVRGYADDVLKKKPKRKPNKDGRVTPARATSAQFGGEVTPPPGQERPFASPDQIKSPRNVKPVRITHETVAPKASLFSWNPNFTAEDDIKGPSELTEEDFKPAGGSLLDGDYDEAEAAASFQNALKEWRGEKVEEKADESQKKVAKEVDSHSMGTGTEGGGLMKSQWRPKSAPRAAENSYFSSLLEKKKEKLRDLKQKIEDLEVPE